MTFVARLAGTSKAKYLTTSLSRRSISLLFLTNRRGTRTAAPGAGLRGRHALHAQRGGGAEAVALTADGVIVRPRTTGFN